MTAQDNLATVQPQVEIPKGAASSSIPSGTSSGPRTPSRLSLREEPTLADSRSVEDAVSGLVQELKISAVIARILVCRGHSTVEAARTFLTPSLKTGLEDPRLIKNLPQAVDLILQSIEEKLQITIYTDFDVDGLSSGSQLYLYLRALGARVNSYTPNRFSEGYGLAKSAVEKLARAGTQLLITVDCGISSFGELALAKRLGMKSIVLDHHQVHKIPPADVVVDPAQEGCPFGEHQLAAAGLVWMLLILIRRMANERWSERVLSGELKLPEPKDFLDLAALGTICDMVPLKGLNRVIAHRGVEAIRKSERPGIVALRNVSGIASHRLSAGHIGFAIGPRINAAGRLGDTREVFELLTTENSLRAKALAEGIDKQNAKRRAVEEDVLNRCAVSFAQDPELLQASAITIFGKEFHLGVIGIVAQRVVEQYHRPTAVMAPGEIIVNGETKLVVKGSIRSIKGFHVAQVLEELKSLLLSGGGHAEAGGFSVTYENLAVFERRFKEEAGKRLSPEMLERRRVADVQVELREVDYTLVNELGLLQPFGIGNPAPMFLTRNVIIDSVTLLSNAHLRLRISDGSYHINAVAWKFQGNRLLRKGTRVDVLYSPELNTYQGVSSVQLNIKEVWEVS